MGNSTIDKLYLELAEKWLNGTISPEEEKVFAEWYNQNQDAIVNIPQHVANSEQELAADIFQKIEERKNRPATVVRPIYQSPFFRVAAAVIILLLGGAIYYGVNKPVSDTIASADVLQKDAKPGGNKAVLKLADGSHIVLDSINNGNIASQGNTKIIKLDNGQLAYQNTNGKDLTASINTLSTPKGGQYQITLADGTNVWLNSGSSISFPTAFTGKERIVELIGEGYFEVAKDASKPFKVKVRGTEVAVLGTHFNVMGYNDEASVKTTLLEGSVKVAAGNATALLTPGQQSQISNGNVVVDKNVDIEEAMAWKNGLFVFNEADVETIMRQIARWYDLEVEYKGKVNKHFKATISRNVEASSVLKRLELTGEVHFQILGKKVIVTP